VTPRHSTTRGLHVAKEFVEAEFFRWLTLRSECGVPSHHTMRGRPAAVTEDCRRRCARSEFGRDHDVRSESVNRGNGV